MTAPDPAKSPRLKGQPVPKKPKQSKPDILVSHCNFTSTGIQHTPETREMIGRVSSAIAAQAVANHYACQALASLAAACSGELVKMAPMLSFSDGKRDNDSENKA